jgi:hypothetical protein
MKFNIQIKYTFTRIIQIALEHCLRRHKEFRSERFCWNKLKMKINIQIEFISKILIALELCLEDIGVQVRKILLES